MLDQRLETFLTLCKIKSYTKTAEFLHITQPAVSQHIKYLEEYCGAKLFNYADKTLSLTQKGETLYTFALTLRADTLHLRQLLRQDESFKKTLSFGATLSIGEYICPKIISKLFVQYPNINSNLTVANTDELLVKLKTAEIDFALIEGYFDKSTYSSALFSLEEFVAVCKPGTFENREYTLQELECARFIIRENGSGSRDILRQILQEHNLSINSFDVCEIGNISVIKHLVKLGHGITFIYKAAVREELESGSLTQIKIKNLQIKREFNLVYLKNSRHDNEYLKWLHIFQTFCIE